MPKKSDEIAVDFINGDIVFAESGAPMMRLTQTNLRDRSTQAVYIPMEDIPKLCENLTKQYVRVSHMIKTEN